MKTSGWGGTSKGNGSWSDIDSDARLSESNLHRRQFVEL
jgi:hypothetical protein